MMSTQIDLKELEKKVFKSNFEDGLWDIYLGMLLMQISLSMFLYQFDLNPLLILLILVLFVGLVFAAFWAAKKYLITPRMGLVTFNEERKRKKKKVTLILSLSVLFGVIVFGLTLGLYWLAVNDGPRDLVQYGWMIPFGLFLVNAVVVFSLIAYFYDYTRAYLYGWFYGLAYPLNIALDEAFDIRFPWFSLTFSAIMIGIGLVLFIRFMRTHPVAQNDASM
jgi:MFS family permease